MKEELYIGKRKIKDIVRSEEANQVAVKYDDNSVDNYTLRQFDSVISEKAYDDSLVQLRKWTPLVGIVLKELLADGMLLYEKDFILDRIDTSITKNYEHVIGLLFNVSDPLKISLPQLQATVDELRREGRVE